MLKLNPVTKPLVLNAVFLFLCCCVAPFAQAGTEALTYQDQVITINGERRIARVPQGYRLELLTTALDGPRLLTFSSNGDLFIGSKSGNVYRLPSPYNAPQVLVNSQILRHCSSRWIPGRYCPQ